MEQEHDPRGLDSRFNPYSLEPLARLLDRPQPPSSKGRMGFNGLLQERVQFLASVTIADHQKGRRGRDYANGSALRRQA